MEHGITERYLTESGVAWTYNPTIKLKDIDIKGSLRNQARIEPLMPEHVESLVAAMAAGAELPALVVCRHPERTHRWFVMDGNHRLAAMAQDGSRATVDAYVADVATKEERHGLTFGFNRLHGARISNREALTQAAKLVTKQGYTTTEAARLCNLNMRHVAEAARIEESMDRAATMEIPPPPSLAHAKAVAAVKNDRVFEAMVNASQCIPTGPFKGLVARVRKARSLEGALKTVATAVHESKRAARKPKMGAASAATRVAMLLPQLEAAVADNTFTLSRSQLRDYRSRLRAVGTQMGTRVA